MTTPVTVISARSGSARWSSIVANQLRQLTAARHGEHGSRDARDEVEEHAERGDPGADANDRREPVEWRCGDDQSERRVCWRAMTSMGSVASRVTPTTA